VTLPMMRSGVIAATLFAFIQSFENLDLSLLLVGPGSSTLPVAMLSYLEFRIDPTLAAVATVQVVVIGVLMVVTDRFVKLSRIVCWLVYNFKASSSAMAAMPSSKALTWLSK